MFFSASLTNKIFLSFNLTIASKLAYVCYLCNFNLTIASKLAYVCYLDTPLYLM